MSHDEGAQIRVKFITKNAAIRVTETPFAVPIKLARAGLSQVVNHLLNTTTPKPFDFLIENKFLRTSLEKYIVANSLNDEVVLTLEYVEAELEPEEKKSENHPDWISSVASYNNYVITGCYDGILRVFSTTGELISQIKAHESVIKSVSIHDDYIVTGGKDQSAKVWKLNDDQTIRPVSMCAGHENSVDSVAVLGDQVLTGSWDNTVRVWTIEEEGEVMGGETKKQKTSKGSKTTMKQIEARVILPGHTGAVLAVAFDSNQSHVLYSAAMDRSIKLWDLTTERSSQTMTGQSTLSDISVSASGMILSAHPDNHIRLWDPRAAKSGTTLVQATFQSHKQWVSAVEWSPLNSHQFASCGYDGLVKLWDARSSIPLFTLTAHTGKALDVAWLPNPKPAFASGGEDCKLKLYTTESSSCIEWAEGFGGRTTELKNKRMATPAEEVPLVVEEEKVDIPLVAEEEKVEAPPAPADAFNTDDISHSLDYIMAMGQGLDADKEYTATLDVIRSNPTSHLYSAVSFEELNLPENLLKGVYAMKFSKPSKIQTVALPMILTDPPENLIGQAQSGSGKTATFVLGMLYRATKDTTKQVQSLCIAPTRELARQIMAVVKTMGSFCGIETFLAIPGNDLERGQTITAQIVVGTPGKIESLIKKRVLDLRNLKIFVLDEADVMIGESGMRDRSLVIKKAIKNPSCQILLFSATYADEVREFAEKMVPNHNIITVKKERLSLDEIKQFWIDCKSQNKKYEILSDIFGLLNVGKSVIFVQARETAKKLTAFMREKGHSVGILHGADMAKEVRDQVLDDFRLGTTKVLITTNVLARGIDVLGVSLVVNFDIPVNRDGHPDPETYLHRIGRTGRFGRKGAAINFVYDNKSKMDLAYIENHYEKKIDEAPADDLEALEKLLAWT